MDLNRSLAWKIVIFLLIFQQCFAVSLRKRFDKRGRSHKTVTPSGSVTNEKFLVPAEERDSASDESHWFTDDGNEPYQHGRRIKQPKSSLDRLYDGSKRYGSEIDAYETVHPSGSVHLVKHHGRKGHMRFHAEESKLGTSPHVEKLKSEFRPVILPRTKPTDAPIEKPKKANMKGAIAILFSVIGLLVVVVFICGVCAKFNRKFAAWLSKRDRTGYMPLKRRQKKAWNRRTVNRKNKDVENVHFSTGNLESPNDRPKAKSESDLQQDSVKQTTRSLQEIGNATSEAVNNSRDDNRNDETAHGMGPHSGTKSLGLSNDDRKLLASLGDEDARSKQQRDSVAVEIPSYDDLVEAGSTTDSNKSVNSEGKPSDDEAYSSDCDDSRFAMKADSVRYFFHRFVASVMALFVRSSKPHVEGRMERKESNDDVILYDRQLHSSFARSCISEPELVQIDIRDLPPNPCRSERDNSGARADQAKELVVETFKNSKQRFQRMNGLHTGQGNEESSDEEDDVRSVGMIRSSDFKNRKSLIELDNMINLDDEEEVVLHMNQQSHDLVVNERPGSFQNGTSPSKKSGTSTEMKASIEINEPSRELSEVVVREPVPMELSDTKPRPTINGHQLSANQDRQTADNLAMRKGPAFMYSLRQYTEAELNGKGNSSSTIPEKQMTKRSDIAHKRRESSYSCGDHEMVFTDLSGEKRRKLDSEFVRKRLQFSGDTVTWKDDAKEDSHDKKENDQEQMVGNRLDEASGEIREPSTTMLPCLDDNVDAVSSDEGKVSDTPSAKLVVEESINVSTDRTEPYEHVVNESFETAASSEIKLPKEDSDVGRGRECVEDKNDNHFDTNSDMYFSAKASFADGQSGEYSNTGVTNITEKSSNVSTTEVDDVKNDMPPASNSSSQMVSSTRSASDAEIVSYLDDAEQTTVDIACIEEASDLGSGISSTTRASCDTFTASKIISSCDIQVVECLNTTNVNITGESTEKNSCTEEANGPSISSSSNCLIPLKESNIEGKDRDGCAPEAVGTSLEPQMEATNTEAVTEHDSSDIPNSFETMAYKESNTDGKNDESERKTRCIDESTEQETPSSETHASCEMDMPKESNIDRKSSGNSKIVEDAIVDLSSNIDIASTIKPPKDPSYDRQDGACFSISAVNTVQEPLIKNACMKRSTECIIDIFPDAIAFDTPKEISANGIIENEQSQDCLLIDAVYVPEKLSDENECTKVSNQFSIASPPSIRVLPETSMLKKCKEQDDESLNNSNKNLHEESLLMPGNKEESIECQGVLSSNEASVSKASPCEESFLIDDAVECLDTGVTEYGIIDVMSDSSITDESLHKLEKDGAEDDKESQKNGSGKELIDGNALNGLRHVDATLEDAQEDSFHHFGANNTGLDDAFDLPVAEVPEKISVKLKKRGSSDHNPFKLPRAEMSMPVCESEARNYSRNPFDLSESEGSAPMPCEVSMPNSSLHRGFEEHSFIDYSDHSTLGVTSYGYPRQNPFQVSKAECHETNPFESSNTTRSQLNPIEVSKDAVDDDDDSLYLVDSWPSRLSSTCSSSTVSIECSSIEDNFDDDDFEEFVLARQVLSTAVSSKKSSDFFVEWENSKASDSFDATSKVTIARVMSDSGINIKNNGSTQISSPEMGACYAEPASSNGESKKSKKDGKKKKVKSNQSGEASCSNKKRWKFIKRIFRKKKTKNSPNSNISDGDKDNN